ncbi:MAG: DUF3515 domain-containing protein [Actinomycetota bacterium]|nr:DUF3515 domain-containing protein [Actinomycetota bacterium]
MTGDSSPSTARSDDPTAILSFAAPPRANVDVAPCAKVLALLPVTLTGLTQRVVHTKPDTPFVVAWGNPAVVLRCGVARPKDISTTSDAQFIQGGVAGGPFYDVQRVGNGNSFTTVDRAAYISITVPSKYQGGDLLPSVSQAIAKALPAICTTLYTAPAEQRCSHRK